MATNALAPAPVNALAQRMDPLFLETAKYPQYGNLVGYLSARRMMPQIEPGFSGEFLTGSALSTDVPVQGIIKATYPSTLVHELTHAANRQMSWQYDELRSKNKNKTLTPEEAQFMQAYEKLVYNRNTNQGTQSLTAQRIAPDWAKAKADYRATGPELSAFGMGSTVSPNSFNLAPAHVDPSYGTEFQILLDLAAKAQRQQPVTDKR